MVPRSQGRGSSACSLGGWQEAAPGRGHCAQCLLLAPPGSSQQGESCRSQPHECLPPAAAIYQLLPGPALCRCLPEWRHLAGSEVRVRGSSVPAPQLHPLCSNECLWWTLPGGLCHLPGTAAPQPSATAAANFVMQTCPLQAAPWHTSLAHHLGTPPWHKLLLFPLGKLQRIPEGSKAAKQQQQQHSRHQRGTEN